MSDRARTESTHFAKIAKALVAVGVLTALFFLVGKEAIVDALKHFEPIYLIHLSLLSYLLIWISCVKWRLFLRSSGNDATIHELMRLYTIGYFFNLFTPSFIGGDIARSYQLGRQVGSQRDAFVATLLERFTGLWAMTTLGVLFVLLGSTATKGLELSICIIGALALGAAAVCFSERASKFAFATVERFVRMLGMKSFAAQVSKLCDKVSSAFSAARGNPKLVLQSLLLSFVYHVMTVLNTYYSALAVGWERPSLSGLFVVVPLALLVGMIPVTPSGIGIQEGAFLFFLERIGATRAEALLVGVILRIKAVLIGILGGALLASAKKESARSNSVGAEVVS